MESVTLGQISSALAWIVAFASSITAIILALKKIIEKQLSPLNHKIEKLDMNQCRNYLVEFLADVEGGIKKDEAQVKRACEVYDHYKDDLNGNSYIGDKWNKLMK